MPFYEMSIFQVSTCGGRGIWYSYYCSSEEIVLRRSGGGARGRGRGGKRISESLNNGVSELHYKLNYAFLLVIFMLFRFSLPAMDRMWFDYLHVGE
mmetsp:Transcript_13775/g.25948  ORF Transcript_13775/g.25948 Transcript_13775/m.25948 type:complete len:96 (-) Transcript_13775:3326-3613(-)